MLKFLGILYLVISYMVFYTYYEAKYTSFTEVPSDDVIKEELEFKFVFGFIVFITICYIIYQNRNNYMTMIPLIIFNIVLFASLGYFVTLHNKNYKQDKPSFKSNYLNKKGIDTIDNILFILLIVILSHMDETRQIIAGYRRIRDHFD